MFRTLRAGYFINKSTRFTFGILPRLWKLHTQVVKYNVLLLPHILFDAVQIFQDSLVSSTCKYIKLPEEGEVLFLNDFDLQTTNKTA